NQSGPLQADVLAGGDIRPGRQNVTHFTVENAVDVDHALGAAVGITQGGWRFTSIKALADGMERGAFHLNIPAAFRVGPRRLRGGVALMAFTARAFQAAVFVHNIRAALLIAGKFGGVGLAFFVLAFGVQVPFFYGNVTAGLLLRTWRIGFFG